MNAPSLATSMILLFLGAWAAAEYYVRRGRAHDAARIRRAEALRARSGAVTALRERPSGQVVSFPTSSGPYR